MNIFFTIALIGAIAGTIMGAWSMIVRMTRISKLNMANFLGCMVTGESSGSLSFVIGIIMYCIFSVAIAFIYVAAITHLQMPVNWHLGLLFGSIHWIISGLILPLMDQMNICIAKGSLAPLKAYAYGYGLGATFDFFIGHLIYGLVVCGLCGLWIR